MKFYLQSQTLLKICYAYLILPIIIFFIGWLNLPLIFLSLSVTTIGVYFSFKKIINNESFIKLDLIFLFFSFVILFIWVGFSGIGGFGYQNYDFHFRNAVFRDLITFKWPIIYDYSGDLILQQIIGDKGALVYFFTFWLPSALVGKLFGWWAANVALFIWTLIGLFLTVLLINQYIGKTTIVLVLAFIFASGLDIVGTIGLKFIEISRISTTTNEISLRYLIGNILPIFLGNEHLEWWAGRYLFQYSSFTTQLFWVFNSSIPTWLVTLLLLNEYQKKNLLFSYAPVLFYAPFSAIGLIPFLIYKFYKLNTHHFQIRKPNFSSLKEMILDNFSFQNTVIPIVFIFVSFLFLGSQVGNHPYGLIWDFNTFSIKLILIYLSFCFLEFLLYGLFVVDIRKEKFLFFLTLGILLILPLYKYGSHNDFTMRASISWLLIFFTISFKHISSKPGKISEKKQQVLLILLLILFLLGSVTPLHEIIRSRDEIIAAGGLPEMTDNWSSFGQINNFGREDPEFKELIKNFIVNPENSFFFNFLSRN